MLTSIRSISRQLGGKKALLDVLQQFANAGEDDPSHGLKKTLTETDDLKIIFAQISEGGPMPNSKRQHLPRESNSPMEPATAKLAGWELPTSSKEKEMGGNWFPER